MIDAWLWNDLDAPRMQRHTAKRIFDRLLDEDQAIGLVSYGMVRDYVASRRREIRVEAAREPAMAFDRKTTSRDGKLRSTRATSRSDDAGRW